MNVSTLAQSKATSEVNYHNRVEVSRSDLALFRESRREFRAIKDRKISWRDEDKFSDDLDVGTAAHLLLLEPDRFLDEVIVWDGKVRAGEAWKRFKKKADAEGKIILKESDWWLVAVAGAVIQNRMSKIFGHKEAFREETIAWDHTLPNGENVSLRCRLDIGIVTPEFTWIFDLKTMAHADERKAWQDIRNRAYWLQDAHYSAAAMHHWGVSLEQTRFVFVPIGKAVCKRIANKAKDSECEWGEAQLARCREAAKGMEPLASSMVELSYEQRVKAIEKWNQLLMEYMQCVRSGDWSDPGENDVKVVEDVVS